MTRRGDFKDLVRARQAQTGEPYTVAKRAVEVDRLEDSTKIISDGVARELRRLWPALPVDLMVGGLFPADEPASALRTYRSHFLRIHIPSSSGPVRTKIEVRTDERIGNTSVFQAYAWIDGDDDQSLERHVDLLQRRDVNAFVRDVVELIRRRVDGEPGAPLLRFFSVYCDYVTSTRAGADSTFQVISLKEGDADMTHLVDQGVHYHNLDELCVDIGKALRVDPEYIEVDEIEEV